MTPIESMFYRAGLKCTVCGAPWTGKVTCGCWIRLHCPTCDREKQAALDPTDPPGTALIMTPCPECNSGDKAMVEYFDKTGKQLMVNVATDGRDKEKSDV